MSWILAFVGFALLIIFHELGHFSAAKAVGMRVEKFSLFFGAPLAKFSRGETTYSVGSIPLGGYVKITGMSPDEARELPPELYARSYAGSPVWKRIFVIAAGPFVNLLIAFLMLAGIFWHQGRAVPGIAVYSVEAGYSAASVLKDNDRILKVTSPDTGAGQAKTVLGDRPGVPQKQLDARTKQILSVITTGGCGARSLGTTYKGAGDPTPTPEVAKCTEPRALTVTVLRDGATQNLQVTPKYDPLRKRYRLGLSFADPLVAIGPVSAAGESITQMWSITKLTVSSVVKIFYNSKARKEVSSVVGGYEATRQSFEVSTIRALSIIALISLSLAIINLFPFLPLDGGHIFWAVVEKLRGGKPVATVVMERATIVGFMLVIALFLVGLNNDLGRIFSGQGFGVR